MIGLLATRMTLWAGGWWGTVKPFVGAAKKAKAGKKTGKAEE